MALNVYQPTKNNTVTNPVVFEWRLSGSASGVVGFQFNTDEWVTLDSTQFTCGINKRCFATFEFEPNSVNTFTMHMNDNYMSGTRDFTASIFDSSVAGSEAVVNVDMTELVEKSALIVEQNETITAYLEAGIGLLAMGLVLFAAFHGYQNGLQR